MHWIDRLNIGQRVVVVVTVGLAIGVVANYLTGLGVQTGLGVRTGWYAYAPLSGQVSAGLGEPGWLRLVIWLAAIGLWALTSLRVLSQSPGPAARR
jgi:heme/copper-type cytochrome/quinol oxidase subunit 1